MTLHRIRQQRTGPTRRERRDQRRLEQSASVPAARREAARATAQSVKRETDDEETEAETEYRDYEERVAPAAAKIGQLCQAVTLEVLRGEFNAKRILAALKPPADQWIAAYSRKYQNDLRLVCQSCGLDPATGKRA